MFAKIIIAFAFCFIYWFVCFLCTGTEKKNLIGLRSYPDEVQCIVKKEESLKPYLPKEKSIMSVLFGNFLLFTVIFSVLGIVLKNVLGLTNYFSAFLYFLFLGELLGIFDLLIIDLLWWRNTKRIRFSFILEKQAYQNLKKHVESFLRGIPLFVVVAFVAAALVSLI